MLTNIDAIIFDLDGTLIDSMWLWKAIDIDYLAKFNIEFPDDLQDNLEGKSFTETAMYFKERFDIPDSIEEIKETWNTMALDYYVNKVPLKEGVLEFLDLLKSKGIKIGIATSNSRFLVEKVLSKLNISEYFDTIRTSCEVKEGKPSPDVYLKVAEDLEVSPSRCLVFEDVPNGIKAGKNANMKVCAIQDDFSKKMEEEKKMLADYFIDNYYQLLEQNEEYKNEA